MRFGAKSIWALTLALFLAIVAGHAQESQPSEYQIKAAFLFNFAKFVEWPPQAFSQSDSPFIIGVLGENPFGDDLERTIRNKTVNNRPLVVKEFHSVSEAKNCHILFISPSGKKDLPEIFKTLNQSSILLVSETENFVETGGMVNFVMEDNKIRFQINDATAKKVGLKISSKLLSLAQRPAH